jgi:hypothetical protein
MMEMHYIQNLEFMSCKSGKRNKRANGSSILLFKQGLHQQKIYHETHKL